MKPLAIDSLILDNHDETIDTGLAPIPVISFNRKPHKVAPSATKQILNNPVKAELSKDVVVNPINNSMRSMISMDNKIGLHNMINKDTDMNIDPMENRVIVPTEKGFCPYCKSDCPSKYKVTSVQGAKKLFDVEVEGVASFTCAAGLINKNTGAYDMAELKHELQQCTRPLQLTEELRQFATAPTPPPAIPSPPPAGLFSPRSPPPSPPAFLYQWRS